MMQGILKECYVLIERLPEHIIKKSYVKVDIKYEDSSHEIEEHDDSNDNTYKNNVSHLSFCND